MNTLEFRDKESFEKLVALVKYLQTSDVTIQNLNNMKECFISQDKLVENVPVIVISDAIKKEFAQHPKGTEICDKLQNYLDIKEG